MKLDTTTEGWFPDGIEILPRPRYALLIAAGLVACAFAIAARLLLPRVHRARTDLTSGRVACPTADQIVTKDLGNARGGSIVRMHLGGYNTFAALPRIVAGLRAAGYDLVTNDEMSGG